MAIILIYGGIGAVLIALGIIFYMFSVSSRKGYVCPQCGERMQTEHMDASRCNTCGAPLKREV